MEKIYCLAVVLLVGLAAANGNVCTKPEVSAQSYTTPDATILTNIGFVAEFTLKCGNGVQNPALFAELGGKTQPVARIGANKYQVRPLLFVGYMGCMLHSNQAPAPMVQGAFGQGTRGTPYVSLGCCDLF